MTTLGRVALLGHLTQAVVGQGSPGCLSGTPLLRVTVYPGVHRGSVYPGGTTRARYHTLLPGYTTLLYTTVSVPHPATLLYTHPGYTAWTTLPECTPPAPAPATLPEWSPVSLLVDLRVNTGGERATRPGVEESG